MAGLIYKGLKDPIQLKKQARDLASSPTNGLSLQLKALDFASAQALLLPVQAKGSPGPDIHQMAAVGISGGGGALPHLDRIQHSFGGHDVTGVNAHVGGKAGAANQAMGAEAYATGNDIAFKSSPDLHTAAHEAAHSIQQRTGISLPGGVGQTGDRYEKQADRVADAVVAGKSAEPMLGELTGGSANQALQGRFVQLKPGDPPSQEFPENFEEEMWDNHPHMEGREGGISSGDVNKAQGWRPEDYANTCAIRMSVMFNNMGGVYKITPDKVEAAGIKRSRAKYSSHTKWYYLRGAREIWKYVTHWFGAPQKQFPASGRYADSDEFQKDHAALLAYANGKKGVVAFDKIFTYSGTGHVDLFDGEELSDSSSWYESQRIMLWTV
jgi:hypothetical protein